MCIDWRHIFEDNTVSWKMRGIESEEAFMPDPAAKWRGSLDLLLFQSTAEHPNPPTPLVGYRSVEMGSPQASPMRLGETRAHKASSLTASSSNTFVLVCHKTTAIFSIYHNMKMVRIHLGQTEPGFNI